MIEHLKVIVGEGNVSCLENDKITYATDASQLEGSTVAVVWPQNPEQIRQILTYANRLNMNIVPRGAGSGLAGAVVPNNSLVLDFSRMNKILKFHPEDNTLEVEPGVVVDDIIHEAEKYELFFPVSPSSHTICQIGGMIATNAAGNRAITFGSTEKWVQELDVLDGTGKFFTMKHNLNEFIGKEGTTGIIVRARLKLTKPLKRTTASLSMMPDEPSLIKKIKELTQNEHLIALEFINKKASVLMGREDAYLLFAEFESLDGEMVETEEIDKVWQVRENAYPSLASQGYSIIEDPKISLEHLEEFLKWLSEKNIPAFGHIGIGIVHPIFKIDDEALIKDMHELVKKLHGAVTGEHGYGMRKGIFINDAYKYELKLLKQRYDPNDILNRGKLV